MNTWGEIKFKLEMDVHVHVSVYMCEAHCVLGLRACVQARLASGSKSSMTVKSCAG